MDLTQITGTALLVALVELLGVVAAVHAVMRSRTSQGAIAWVVGLLSIPFVAIPLYLVFGRSKFYGYVKSRRAGSLGIHGVVRDVGQRAVGQGLISPRPHPEHAVLESLAMMPFTSHNRATLMVDGEATFEATFAAIDSAKDYVLVQFFIIRNDRVGRELKARLVARAAEGVRVYVLYDEIGSHKLSGAYINELTSAGVCVRSFYTTRGYRNRLQLNFRNHRKIVVVDGRVAYVGGMNVGDEYLGRDPKFSPWRDTAVELIGPAVHAVQLTFLEDWHWATGELPELDWSLRAAEDSDQQVLVLPSGPADRLETCGLFFVHAISLARRRLWIATPYFVPDGTVMAALQLAAMRGVDVRVMLPEKPDHLMVHLSAFSYLDEAGAAGVKIYRYQPGFMHQKVLLVDDQIAAVGTANLDNRSFRLNFEVTVVVDDRKFAGEVAEMLERDFANTRPTDVEDLAKRSFLFRLAVRVSRLLAPVQ